MQTKINKNGKREREREGRLDSFFNKEKQFPNMFVHSNFSFLFNFPRFVHRNRIEYTLYVVEYYFICFVFSPPCCSFVEYSSSATHKFLYKYKLKTKKVEKRNTNKKHIVEATKLNYQESSSQQRGVHT